MAKTITFACWDYDRVMPVMDGTVPVEGYEVCPIILKPADLFPRTLQRQEFDVSELSYSSYMLQTSRGKSDYIAIPVFTSRAFRHSSIYVRKDAGINEPKDLEGKKVGIPEYQMTLVVWARGMLQDEYGVDIKKMKLRRGATNYAGLKSVLSWNCLTTLILSLSLKIKARMICFYLERLTPLSHQRHPIVSLMAILMLRNY